MADKRFMDILSSYLSPEEVERLKGSQGQSKEEYLNARMAELGMRPLPDTMDTSIRWIGCSRPADGYPVAVAKIRNRGGTAARAWIDADIGRLSIEPIEVRIGPEDTVEKELSLSCTGLDQSMVNEGSECRCTVKVRDAYGRILESRSENVVFIEPGSTPAVTASVAVEQHPPSDDRLCTVRIELISAADTDSDCDINIFLSDEGILSRKVRIHPGSRVPFTIDLDRTHIPPGGARKTTVKIVSEGSVIASESFYLRLVPAEMKTPERTTDATQNKPALDPRIACDCTVCAIVDPHHNEGGNVELGSIGIENSEDEPQYITAVIRLDGVQVTSIRRAVPHGNTVLPILAPAKSLYRDDAYAAELDVEVLDGNSKTVLMRSVTVDVLSRYDIDLHKLGQRTAEFINPLHPTIKSLVDRRDGPLAEAMGDEYTVCGYQIQSRILPQLEAVWAAVCSLRMSYVSDVSTLENGFQRVRTPEKVLEDRTGNCIELSILFASILESMDFEPVVVFPNGHAVVGIVVSTDMYPSESCGPDSTVETVRIDVDGRSFTAICFESTLVQFDRVAFRQAIHSAAECIAEQKRWIEDRGRFILVSKARLDGIRPSMR